jgi:spore maturation protein CgeB
MSAAAARTSTETRSQSGPRILVVTAGLPSKASFLAEAFAESHEADVLPGKAKGERRIDAVLRRVGLGRAATNARRLNRELRSRARDAYDLVCVIKGLSVERGSVEALKAANPKGRVVLWTCDDQYLPHNQSRAFLEAAPAYDMIFTCKSQNLDGELSGLGFRRVEFLYQAYSEIHHQPAPNPVSRHAGRVVFVGFAERERFDHMNHLARNGVEVDVYGSGWERAVYRRRGHPNLKLHMRPLIGAEYTDALSNAAVSLCFLRALNRDRHTSRTFEIPACGGFMIGERTAEHQALFEEGREAEFFASPDELLAKVRRYLADPVRRAAVAQAGFERTRNSEYSYRRMVERIIEVAFDEKGRTSP